MKNPITIYLHDHLAGAEYALDLVKALEHRYEGDPLGEFAANLYSEISSDKEVLHKLAEVFGSASDPFKDGAAWLGEKVSRIKLNHDDAAGLGTFEALEFLTLGIHGKAAMWRALSEVAPDVTDLANINFGRLISRAELQERMVEEQRLMAARKTLLCLR